MDDDAFVWHGGGRLAELPGVEAVTLGGSRAEGANRPDSDWDFSLYYRGRFEPRALRDVGWPGEVGAELVVPAGGHLGPPSGVWGAVPPISQQSVELTKS